jgi:hypothetical protein
MCSALYKKTVSSYFLMPFLCSNKTRNFKYISCHQCILLYEYQRPDTCDLGLFWLSYSKEWKLLRSKHISIYLNGESFLVFFTAFATFFSECVKFFRKYIKKICLSLQTQTSGMEEMCPSKLLLPLDYTAGLPMHFFVNSTRIFCEPSHPTTGQLLLNI